MRVTFRLSLENDLSLPLSYNHLIQSFIYRNLKKELSDFLHNKGFTLGKRNFKLFTFSKIKGNFRIEKENIIFSSPVEFTLSSPFEDLISELAHRLLKKRILYLGKNRIELESINVHLPPRFEEKMEVYFLTPVTVYSTLYTKDGKKKTYYYSPKEREFGELIEKNLLKKYSAFHKILPDGAYFKIIPFKVKAKDEKIIKFKGFIIKGWLGRYKIEGNKELIKFGYYAGLGAKNSQGFGMFEVVK
ncbi:MAG: CRISPR-associated endoribonuclease Cas6 [Caldiserica bacterium]|nr:MAG: CRISPR-associated endoribonuclease Cas6 [Caldisericota bacterium]